MTDEQRERDRQEVADDVGRAQARIPVALAERVAGVDGVRTVVADRSIPATVATADGRLLAGPDGNAAVGHGWGSAALTPYSLAAGRAPSTPGEVVLDATLAAQRDVGVGAQVRLTSSDGTSSYVVVGVARPPRGREWQGAVFVTDALAARLAADRARVDALGVHLEDGADPEQVAQRVQRTVGGRIGVYTGHDRGKVESLATAQRNEELIALGGAFGSFAVLLAIFVVAATLGLSVLQRGREMALLRAVGAKPRQVRRLLLGEAVLVALAAGLVGLAPGVLLGWFLFYQLQGRGIGAETASLVVGPLPVVIAVGVGLVTGVGVGDPVSLWLGDGEPTTLRVVATYASNLGFGEFVLPRDVVAAHVSVPMDARMLVRYADGADAAALDAELATLAEDTPGLKVVDRAAMQAADVEQARLDGWVNYLMIGVLLAFIAVAAVNSLVMATGERSRELALLRLVGATPRQVTRMVRGEALAVIGFGVLLGLAIAAATLVPFSLAIAETAIPYLPWQVVAGVLVGAAVLGLGASELPARNALRRDPVEAIGAQA